MRTALHTISAAALAGFLGGCEAIERQSDNLFGDTASPVAEAAAQETAYAVGDEVAVHAGASAASPVIGRLRLHERVTYRETQDGFAHVASGHANLSGWVDTAELTSQVPASTASHATPRRAAPAPRPTPPESPPTAAAAEADAPAASEPIVAAPVPPDAAPVAKAQPIETVAEDDPPPTPEPKSDRPAAATPKPTGEMLNPF